VAGVVVECAGRGGWSSDTNDGLATGPRELVVDVETLAVATHGVKAETQTAARDGQ
jgi:hypothetical protein